MARISVLSPERWDELRLASVKGVPDQELSLKYGVKLGTIRAARCRDDVWSAAVSPRIAHKKVRMALVAESNSAHNLAVTIDENAENLSQRNRLMALKAAGKGLERAFDSKGNLHKHLVITSLDDLKTVTDIAAKAGLWGGDQQVVVNCQAFATAPVSIGGKRQDNADENTQIIDCK